MQQHQTKAKKRRRMKGLKVPTAQGGNPLSLASLPPPPDNQKCPRCESIDTKFCYYNNYSITQPRYFCRDCRRYWTQGGSLRNVPHGGRSLKAKLITRLPSSPTYLLARATHKSVSKKQNDDHQPESPIIPPQQQVQQVHQSGGGGGGGGGGGDHDQEFDESLNQLLSINNNGGIMKGSASTCDLSLLQGLDELQIPQLLAQVHEYGEFNVGNQTNMTNTINADINDQEHYSWYDQSFNINNSSSNVVITTNGGFWSANTITNGCDDQPSMNTTSTTNYSYEALGFGNGPLYQPSTTQAFY